MLSIFILGENAAMETQNNAVFGHDEMDITMIYVLETKNFGKGMIRVLSDDTDEFVLLVYWVYLEDLECKV